MRCLKSISYEYNKILPLLVLSNICSILNRKRIIFYDGSYRTSVYNSMRKIKSLTYINNLDFNHHFYK